MEVYIGVKLTNSEFIDKFNTKNSNYKTIEILSKYIKSNERIKCHCLVCDYLWSPYASDLLRNKGCPKCSGHYRRTNSEFLADVKNSNRHFDEIEFLSSFTRRKDKILCRCKVCKHEWKTIAESLLGGVGCPKCSGTSKLTQEEFLDKLRNVNPNIEITGDYVNNHTKIEYKCKIDGFRWSAKPNDLLSGKGCPACKSNKMKTLQSITHEDFLNALLKKNIQYRHGDIVPIGSYINRKTKIKFHCNICNKTWDALANSLLCGCGCPYCKMSNGERIIANYLSSKKIKYISQHWFVDLYGDYNRHLRYDFYIPKINTLIEYQGEQHYKPVKFFDVSDKKVHAILEKQIRYDNLKRNYANKNNISLIEIPYWDLQNIETKLNSYFESEEKK